MSVSYFAVPFYKRYNLTAIVLHIHILFLGSNRKQ